METVSFATARKGTSQEALAEARRWLNRGYGFQNVARITGLNELTLREAFAPLRAKKPEERSRPVVTETYRARRARPVPPSPQGRRETKLILQGVCHRYRIAMSDLLGPNQSRRFAWPRQEAYALLRRERGLTLHQIAPIFKRDHTTILLGIDRCEQREAWCDVMLAFTDFDTHPNLFREAA